ncbi:YbaK/EbsC family protein [Streptomyces sp. NPDC053048]|uniref:YbaK/EbsC family protein n=1 Tax=Streptomyces sp. NPDC053048 TaxID=3365694 RepID=UPI0037D2AC7E
MRSNETYEKLIALLDEHGAAYRTIDHEAEGGTEAVSRLRGHGLEQAAKCIVVMVKLGKKTKRYVLAVVAGHQRVDLAAIKALLGGSYAGFASQDVAERLSGCESGTILPFSFDPELELVVDPALLEQSEFFFNAARLDRSLALSTDDYLKAAQPRVEPIGVTAPSA